MVVATVLRTSPVETDCSRRIRLLRDYAALCKVRVLFMVVIVWVVGFDLSSLRAGSFRLTETFFIALLGISALTAGSSALNQVFERTTDRLMVRTALRPLPQNRLSLAHGLAVGLILVVGGLLLLLNGSNLLSSCLALAASVGYVGVYTPLKRVTRLNVVIGAIFGALPPLIGWTSVSGSLGWLGVALFAILFVWQLPHVTAIGWLNRDDYIRAGIRVPATLCDRHSAARCAAIWAVLFTIVIIPVSLWPIQLHTAGSIYMVAATGLGIWYFGVALKFARIANDEDQLKAAARARDLLRASVVYLPTLLLALVLNVHNARWP